MARETIAGRYRLLQPLGGGAMASVWLADDPELGRRVAVKLLGPDADQARFEREARAVARLSHPNICQVFDYGEDEGRPYMVLEQLAGGSLDERIQRGRALPDDETDRIAREIAQGLAHAHERGLVHRDLKPANILFDGEGRAKIADFGIARMGGTGTLTAAGTVLGTAAYISPEQARGEPATAASDVYSFGTMLFLMLTGRLPFEAAGAMELAAMHRDVPAPSVHSVRPDAPQTLAETADASLAKDPRARPADGEALMSALAGGGTPATLALPLTGEPTQVIPRARPPAARRSRRVLPLALLGAGLLAAAGLGVAFLATGSGSDNPTPGPTLPDISAPPASEPSTATTTTAPTTTARTTEPTTTAATTTAPATTAATTTAPTTTAPPTTAATTTAATTTTPTETTIPTDTLPTTTITTTAVLP